MIWRWLYVVVLFASLFAFADDDNIDKAAVQSYQETIGQYLKNQVVADGWEWFSHRSHGFKATPMILIKLLPELDSDIWGPPAEKFSRFGHYVLPGDEKRSLPTSLGMSSFPPNSIIVTTETCATCHMGRVRLKKNDIMYLYGGVNVQFDVRKWRTALEKTVAKYLKNNAAIKNTATQLREIVRTRPEGYFHSDLAEDRRQRDYFVRRGSSEMALTNFVAWTRTFTDAKARQRATSHRRTGFNYPPNIDEGYPGKLDASGDLLAERLWTNQGMPAKASLTDIPSVWRQIEYSSGQWDGSVTDQFIRNLAAQVAVVPGTTVDRRVANHALDFVGLLPPPKFPFLSKRRDLVDKGESLFKTNCVDCHRPRNNRFYPDVATDLSRATVMTTIGTALILKIFYDACHATLPDGTSPRACGDFVQYLGGASKKGPSYVAKPLTGIWARAPYLHNGSVPTLKHLLMKSLRPQKFVVGSLSYDSEAVGFAWDSKNIDEYRKLDPYVYEMDTGQDGLSNQGHDQERLVLDGKVYFLDWSKDEAGAEALLEYLKTL
jgi:hypothetical protein